MMCRNFSHHSILSPDTGDEPNLHFVFMAVLH